MKDIHILIRRVLIRIHTNFLSKLMSTTNVYQYTINI